jgi:hypothetical protein
MGKRFPLRGKALALQFLMHPAGVGWLNYSKDETGAAGDMVRFEEEMKED